jgi:O-antigen ligase
VYFGLRLIHGWRFGGINRRFFRVLVFTSVALAVTAAALFTNPSIRHMLEIRLGQGGLQDYDAVRFYTHDRAWETAGKKPLGLGPGQSEVIFAYSTHSMYLRVLAENGVPGFVLFFGAVFWGMWRSLRAALSSGKAETAVLSAFVAACMAGILVNGAVIDVNHWRHFWLLLAMAWCCPMAPAEERSAYAPGVYRYACG